jgi:lysophospholipase L1-like esterase
VEPAGRASGHVWLRRLLALSLGAALVCTVEAALRLVPSLAPPSFTIATASGDRDLNRHYPGRFFAGFAGDRFASRLEMLPHPHLETPANDSYRLLFLGGSTAQGYPHPPHATAAAHLQDTLQVAWPQKRVEVFNASIIAVSSFAVARTLEAAIVLQPDVVVIYSGHNEFYGAYGAASLRLGGRSISAKRIHYTLMQSRLAGLARRVIDLFRSGRDVSAKPSDSLLDVMASAGEIGPDDERREMARENLRQNLTWMVRYCRQRDIPVVLCTLVGNDTGFEPEHATTFVDIHPPAVRDKWEDLIARADALLSLTGKLDPQEAQEALSHLDEAAEIYDRHAFLHFLRGKALVAGGRAADARAEFLLARNLDTTPWRAPSAFNGTISQVALSEGAVLADVREAFQRQSPPQGVGTNLMSDHLHPSRSGQLLLARTVATSLLDL